MVLCDELGYKVGGRLEREGIYVYILLIHFHFSETQQYKTIILQLKKILRIFICQQHTFIVFLRFLYN